MHHQHISALSQLYAGHAKQVQIYYTTLFPPSHIVLHSHGYADVFCDQIFGARLENVQREAHHGVLQRLLVACGPVLGPLRPLGVNVPKQQLLDLPSMLAVLVPRLHSHQSQLHQGEAHGGQTRPPCPAVVELEGPPHRHPVQGGTHAGGRQPGRQPLLCRRAVHHYGHLGEVVISLGGPAGDPGGVAQPQLPPDAEGVGGVLAAAVCVVVLQGLEVTAGVEGVRAGEELGARPDFTPAHRGERRVGKRVQSRGRCLQSTVRLGHRNTILSPRMSLEERQAQYNPSSNDMNPPHLDD